jgi:uncharacterized protein (UPF0548 family)
MALWRFGRGWSEETMRSYLAALAERPVNFSTPPEVMTRENGWTVDGAETQIGVESPGPPGEDGLFARARQGIIQYDFSDPRIVVGHFDPQAPFAGRNMLLEIKCLGLHFLNGVRVHSVREEIDNGRTLFGFRYDTLEGHIEQGFEWFLLTKNHQTGAVRFKIEAHWRLGQFPNWWSRLGFRLIGERYRALWRRRAPERLRELAQRPGERPAAVPGRLAHRGDVSPQRSEETATSPGKREAG